VGTYGDSYSLGHALTVDTTAPQNSISYTQSLLDTAGSSGTITLSGNFTTSGDNAWATGDFLEYTTDSGSNWKLATSTGTSGWSLSVDNMVGGVIGMRMSDTAGNTSSTVYMGDGNGVNLTIATTGETFYSGAGSDTIAVSASTTSVSSAGGADTLTISGAGNTIYGGEGNDAVTSTGDSNTLYLQDGDDTASVSGENDIIYGGDGSDTISVKVTSVTVDGGAGTDTLKFINSMSLSSLVGKVTNIEKLYVSSGETLTINGISRSDVVAMGFSTSSISSQTYAVMKVDGDTTAHLSMSSYSYYSSATELVGSLGSLATGYYTYVDTTNNVIVLVGSNFITS
jgi:Ca2+-binding RTX toxin-like protein